MNNLGSVSPKINKMLHGCDYNPEQWLDYPEILDQDIKFMKLAKINVVSVGIFAWSMLEPEEGIFRFDWLDKVIDKLWENKISVILATPSGGKPVWMAKKYIEINRVNRLHLREHYNDRHNHCFTSPVYREKTAIINKKLAERFGNHPAVIMWHISNEFSGECHCEYCQQAFRVFLKNKYKTIDALNHDWWATFWSHSFNSFDDIEAPSDIGDTVVCCQNLDWMRFVSHQTAEFIKHEINSVKSVNSSLPFTTNLMRDFKQLDYFKLAKELDVVSWDSYPYWHKGDDIGIAINTAFWHDVIRSLKKDKPFMLMESTPSTTNWQPVSKLKRPKMHLLSSMQAIAHGSDTVQYFQWRKSRGSNEKLHGAVVDHNCSSDTRVFNDVADVGRLLEKLPEICGTGIRAEVAIILDWENWWAAEFSQGPRNCGLNYLDTIKTHYSAFWKQGISVDFVDSDCDLCGYKLVIAPMLYMFRSGIEDKIIDFTDHGGFFVATYFTGVVNESDLCFMNGFPGKLKPVLGIVSDEIDGLYDGEHNSVKLINSGKSYKALELCELLSIQGAEVLGTYEQDFYKGYPFLTKNQFGRGSAFYIAARTEQQFLDDFYSSLGAELELTKPVENLPKGVSITIREDEKNKFIFVMNFSSDRAKINFKSKNLELLTNKTISQIELESYDLAVFQCL